ncbi:MAG: hypothetical protein WCK37_00615 [Candidatus Falkowbacteria bacterium]
MKTKIDFFQLGKIVLILGSIVGVSIIVYAVAYAQSQSLPITSEASMTAYFDKIDRAQTIGNCGAIIALMSIVFMQFVIFSGIGKKNSIPDFKTELFVLLVFAAFDFVSSLLVTTTTFLSHSSLNEQMFIGTTSIFFLSIFSANIFRLFSGKFSKNRYEIAIA